MNSIVKLPGWYPPAELNEARARILNWGRSLGEHVYLIGQELMWIKQKVGHGGFSSWLSENIWFSERTAQRFMTFARKCCNEGALLEYHPGKNDIMSDSLIDANKLLRMPRAYELLKEWKKEPNPYLQDLPNIDIRALMGEIHELQRRAEKADDVQELIPIIDRLGTIYNEATEYKVRTEYQLGKILISIPEDRRDGLVELVNAPEHTRDQLIIESIAKNLAKTQSW